MCELYGIFENIWLEILTMLTYRFLYQQMQFFRFCFEKTQMFVLFPLKNVYELKANVCIF
jgi:hypothetical protein